MNENITLEMVTKICDLAQVEWDKAKPRVKSVKFKWKGKTLTSTLTIARMLVESKDGSIKVCRYY